MADINKVSKKKNKADVKTKIMTSISKPICKTKKRKTDVFPVTDKKKKTNKFQVVSEEPVMFSLDTTEKPNKKRKVEIIDCSTDKDISDMSNEKSKQKNKSYCNTKTSIPEPVMKAKKMKNDTCSVSVPILSKKKKRIEASPVIIGLESRKGVPTNKNLNFTNNTVSTETQIPVTDGISSSSFSPHLFGSTPKINLKFKKFVFDQDPISPVRPLSLPVSSATNCNMQHIKNFDQCMTSCEPPLPPITTPLNKKRKWMLASEKLRLGLFKGRPKFCPFCSFVCERKLASHIEAKHFDKLKVPISNSIDGINKIICSYSKNSKTLVPLNRIIDLMGDHWEDSEIRKIGYELCNLGQIVTYGGSWMLNHVLDVLSPFDQYIKKRSD